MLPPNQNNNQVRLFMCSMNFNHIPRDLSTVRSIIYSTLTFPFTAMTPRARGKARRHFDGHLLQSSERGAWGACSNNNSYNKSGDSRSLVISIIYRALTFPFTAMSPRGVRTRSGGILRRRRSAAAADSWTWPGIEVVSMRAAVLT